MAMPRKVRCTVESIVDHGGRVYTLSLTPESSLPVFRAGQFLHLTVDEYDPSSFWPDSRVFSIASSPRDRSRLSVCYSVKGAYTGKMEQVLKVGAEVWVKLPYGEFFIDEGRDTVLFAGGTGLSAFTGFLDALQPEHPRKVLLAYGARNASLFLSREMIAERAKQVPNFEALFFAEEAGPGDAGVIRGRLSVDAILAKAQAMADPLFYISGPPAMIKALTAQLTERGLGDRVRTDAWE